MPLAADLPADAVLDTAWLALCHSQDRDDALLLLDALGYEGEELEWVLRQLGSRQEHQGGLDEVKRLILAHARAGTAFSANDFYLTLPARWWPLIGPALHGLRRAHFETVGTELAVHPARKRSRVTVYQLRKAAA